MPKIKWDELENREYETGVDQGVLYNINAQGEYNTGVAWNGLTQVSENPSGAEPTKLYADNLNYITLYSAEEFGATVEAYTYPVEFEKCDGSGQLAAGVTIGQQSREVFGLCYRTKIGDGITQDKGYKYHLIYGAKASPSEKTYETINDSPGAVQFSWEVTTTPISVAGHKPTASLVIDTTKVEDQTALQALENILYGVDAPEFSATETYEIGDYVSHETKLYVCKVAVETPGEWDADNWTEVTNPGPRLPKPDEIATLFAE